MKNRNAIVATLAMAFALATCLHAVAATADGPTPAMLAPAQRWIDAFNAAKTPLPEDDFTGDVVITDQFPPYVWSGTAGMRAWSEAIGKSLKNTRVENEHVVVQAPYSFMIDKAGEHASYVLPATLTYEIDGKPYTDKALWLFVVVKDSAGNWKIAADTWTKTA